MNDKPTIHERDITSSVCQRCAHCCHIRIKLPKTDSRYRAFLRQIGVPLLPPAVEGGKDCCEKEHDAEIDLGMCPHLVESDTKFACALYGTPSFPEMCAEFNCVSWAKAFNVFDKNNRVIQAALRAKEKLKLDVSAVDVAAPESEPP